MSRIIILLWAMTTSVVFAAQQTLTEFTDGMQYQDGFYDLYYKPENGKVYLLVDQFDEAFLFQSSLPQGVGSNDIGLDRGQLGDTRIVSFSRFGDKVLLRQHNTEYRASSDNADERASIDEAFADSVIAGLPVVASEDNRVLVDYTDFLVSDIHGISTRLKRTKQGNFKADAKRSGVFMARTKAFADNTELEALVTFAGSEPGEYLRQVSPDPESVSVHLHHSLIRLPDDNYQSRRFHPYSGYWSISYQDYSVPIDQHMTRKLIPRHRLAKKNPDAAVSEAVEPIVYYLDPGTPEPVRSALLDGARWWNQAFEAIGYKDAFQVKILPAGADPMDVRYNVIQWVHRATRGWSYGSSVIDPRTGEIIKGHVTLGSLRVRQDYLIALGLTSPFVDDNADTREQLDMALARIRQLSAHEVGHTLGIAHNFAASMNDRASVMDYPHPKADIKNGEIRLDDAYDTGIGEWDKHVIAYGYQDMPAGTTEEAYLSGLIQSTRDKGLDYQSDPDARPGYAANAEGHLWDNGADPLSEWQRLAAVRKLALERFGINTLKHGQTLSSLQETLVPVYLMHRYQLDAVAKLIGGVTYEYELKGDYDRPKGVMPVDDKSQKLALKAMIESMSAEFLALPSSIQTLITPKAYGESLSRESFPLRTGITFDAVTAAESSAAYSLSLLLKPERLNRLSGQHGNEAGTLGVEKLVEALLDANVKARHTRIGKQIQSRIAYLTVDALMKTVLDDNAAPEVQADILGQMLDLNQWLKKNGQVSINQLISKQLDWYIQTGQWNSHFTAKPLPPGSPI